MVLCRACRDPGLHEVQLAAELAQPPLVDRQLQDVAAAASAPPGRPVAAEVVSRGHSNAAHAVGPPS